MSNIVTFGSSKRTISAKDMEPGQIGTNAYNRILMRIYNSTHTLVNEPLLIDLETGDYYAVPDMMITLCGSGDKIIIEVE